LLASAALIGTSLHRLVTLRHALAAFCAFPANICARTAILRMMIAHAKHEISACDARLRTVGKQSLMLCGGMLAAHHQAMPGSFHADGVTVQTVLDALSHL
jgi:hypothetical protein